jgi:hypothetical protein
MNSIIRLSRFYSLRGLRYSYPKRGIRLFCNTTDEGEKEISDLKETILRVEGENFSLKFRLSEMEKFHSDYKKEGQPDIDDWSFVNEHLEKTSMFSNKTRGRLIILGVFFLFTRVIVDLEYSRFS